MESPATLSWSAAYRSWCSIACPFSNVRVGSNFFPRCQKPRQVSYSASNYAHACRNDLAPERPRPISSNLFVATAAQNSGMSIVRIRIWLGLHTCLDSPRGLAPAVADIVVVDRRPCLLQLLAAFNDHSITSAALICVFLPAMAVPILLGVRSMLSKW